MRGSATAPVIAPVFVMAFLASCATAPTTPSDPAALQREWRAHLQELQQIAGWELAGRIAVRTPDDGWNALVAWSQADPDRYTIEFSGPFGQGVASLQVRPGAVTLVLPERPPLVSDDAQTLLVRELGWNIPVDALQFWVLGLPAPGMPFEPVFDARGRLAELQQAGWQIAYERYATVDGKNLPGKIGAHNGDIRLRIVIDRWAVAIPDGDAAAS